jgi:chromosomal replication initiation ATPase DnaA
LAIGGQDFLKKVKAMAAGGARETEGKRRLRERVSITQVVEAVEVQKGWTCVELSTLRGDWAKPLAMWAARRFCGLTLAEIGQHFGGMDYSAVSMALKRFDAKAEADPLLRRRRTRLARMLNVEM